MSEPGRGAAEPSLDPVLRGIEPAAAAEPADVRRHLDELTKPPGSLGRLERLAVRLARIYGDPPPRLDDRTVFVLAGDHGVARCGVSAYPADVTGPMCRNLAAGGAGINAVASAVAARVVVADLGVDDELRGTPDLRDLKVRRGTRDLSRGPAMTREETVRAIERGIGLFEREAEASDIVALGEMGIANTTAASAVTAALLDREPDEVVGPGTGLSPADQEVKVRIVRRAVRRVGASDDAVEVLRQVGGFEIAGLVGVVLGAVRRGRAVVTDGFIATTAVAAAIRLCPEAGDYVFASHRSPEPGHGHLLEALGLEPLFELGLRLGEGTGAALALPLLDASGSLLREMATFSSAGVPGSVPEDRADAGPGDSGPSRPDRAGTGSA